MDKSKAYEKNAETFLKLRGHVNNTIGVEEVRKWTQSLPDKSRVLDLGCGNGFPLTKILVDHDLDVYAIDASESLCRDFKKNFPETSIACETAENSELFKLKFDAILSWGLIFLLTEKEQEALIKKVSEALFINGRYLFTAPWQKTRWKDTLTGEDSVSLGRNRYKELLNSAGLIVLDEFQDSGENHYFSCIKK
ncbi:class I SAM-dependent methyltransferase [Christiangramia sp. SM2212]|uniref:Class I SAM-dependent methyltransferase n=1 Tax=Christiangramia sediminicola TaxID=3073267 RepID=A0ABU1EL20_9FLAO|nr:class I SAM-dependent methyltransferase [Christiangramia sp. SM2212]MDR5589081.1 class I SAM-dependent methyltransferase [Christiangramia sp. SM2212]